MTTHLHRELLILVAWLLFLLILGAAFGYVLSFLLFGIIIYLVWTLYNVNKLSKWLAKPSKQAPESIGIWDEIYFQLYNLYKRQRKSRKKLTSILNRFQKSTQALPYATIVLNTFNEIEWFNPAAGQLFDLHTRVDIGQRIDNLIRVPEFARYLNKKSFDDPFKFTLNGRKLILNITRYGNDQYLLSARDITALNKIDDMRRDFISNASHELRTPLTVMSGYIEFLSHHADNNTKVPLEKVEEQMSRMNGIITELMELARLESAQTVDLTTAVEIEPLINSLYREALAIDNNRHDISFDLDSEELKSNDALYLHGNEDEIRMALSNLMTNAIRYTPENGSIKLFVTVTDPIISIGVEDSGIGINYQHIPRLTERFYRVDEGRSREVGGTGLGLAIVKHVLDRHKANLYIQSKEGSGSLFRCDFPMSRYDENEL